MTETTTPKQKIIDILQRTWVYFQYILPHLLLSKLMYFITRLPLGKVTPWLIKQYIRAYQIDMSSAENEDIETYENFNAFFTRALKADARPLAETGIISPVDARISQIGAIDDHTLIQAKGQNYTLQDLFGDLDFLAGLFKNGHYCTLYLSPADYHRIHMPITGQPRDTLYIPGRLFSVNNLTTRHISRVFTRNERVIVVFKTEAGAMAMILVGALFVGSIETAWDGQIAPGPLFGKTQRWQAPEAVRKRGSEMGRFNLGSTVILLFEENRIDWLESLSVDRRVQMGEQLGTVRPRAKPQAKNRTGKARG